MKYFIKNELNNKSWQSLSGVWWGGALLPSGNLNIETNRTETGDYTLCSQTVFSWLWSSPQTSTTLSSSDWDSVWSRLKASLGKEQPSLLAAPTRPRVAFLSLSSTENFRKLWSQIPGWDRGIEGRALGSTYQHHDITASILPSAFTLSLLLHNGWLTFNSRDSGWKITERFGGRSCDSDVTLSSRLQRLKGLKVQNLDCDRLKYARARFRVKIEPFLASYHNSDPNESPVNSSHAPRWETFFIHSQSQNL